MIERDNRDIQFTHLAMENVRLQNLVLEYEEELRLRDVEDAADKAQTAEMLASKDRQIAEQAALIESQKKDIERITADRDQERDSRIKAEERVGIFLTIGRRLRNEELVNETRTIGFVFIGGSRDYLTILLVCVDHVTEKREWLLPSPLIGVLKNKRSEIRTLRPAYGSLYRQTYVVSNPSGARWPLPIHSCTCASMTD